MGLSILIITNHYQPSGYWGTPMAMETPANIRVKGSTGSI